MIEEDDAPPAFPALNGPQRAGAGEGGDQAAAPSSVHGDSSARVGATPPTQAEARAPPSFTVSGPSLPSTASRGPSPLSTASSNSASSSSASSSSTTKHKMASLREVLGVPSPSPSASSASKPSASSAGAGSLMPPPRTTPLSAPAGVGGASGASISSGSGSSSGGLGGGLGVPPSGPNGSGNSLMLGSTTNGSSKRKKVILEPGYGPLDWARLKSSADLRGGITALRKIPLSELKQHKTEQDAWSAFNGKVYNITPYLRFHPGGVKELMRVAGRDGTRLFMLTHSWVNIEAMIDGTMIGFLVSD